MKKVENRMEGNREKRDESQDVTRGFPTVDHRPARCPNCGSTRNDVRSTQRPVEGVVKRYHTCKNVPCGIAFSSQQEISVDEVEERKKDKPKKD